MTAMTNSRSQPKIAHAPLPWTSVANSWQYTSIYDADNLPVCRFDLEDWPVTEDNQDAFEKAQAEVVALVVEAVNSHAAIKARIEELEGALRAIDKHLDNFGWMPSAKARKLARTALQPKAGS